MATESSRHKSSIEVSDLGLGAALAACGHRFQLENRNGRYIFIFHGDVKALERLEGRFFAGTLLLPARDVIGHLKNLKDAIFAAKRRAPWTPGQANP